MRSGDGKEGASAMRGSDGYNERLFSTIRLEDFVPPEYPLRPIRQWVNDALEQMHARFSAMYEAEIKGARALRRRS